MPVIPVLEALQERPVEPQVQAEPPFTPQPGPQTAFFESKADIVVYGGAAGGGKQLPLDTPIMTTRGLIPLSDLRVGDQTFAEDGRPYFVLELHPISIPVVSIRLHFDDGHVQDACYAHLWHTYTRADLDRMTKQKPDVMEHRRKNRPSRATGKRSEAFRASITARNQAKRGPRVVTQGAVRTTLEIAETLTVRGHSNHAIKVPEALECPERDLPIDPYVLGMWLGDGHSASGHITTADTWIVREIRRRGYDVCEVPSSDYGYRVQGLTAQLRKLGVLNNKHIPQEYLLSSKRQRRELLQGLMDSDGTVSPGKASVEFTNCSKAIAAGMTTLLASLGLKASANWCVSKLYGKICAPSCRFRWSDYEKAFLLPRKADRQKLAKRRTAQFRYIIKAELVEPVPMRCITVASPSRLFLCGQSLIPTHNTAALLAEVLRYTPHTPGFNSCLFRKQANQITTSGGLWDEAVRLYSKTSGARFVKSPTHTVTWIGGGQCQFRHLNGKETREALQGAQIGYVGLDEATHLSEEDFWFILSRNRSSTGIKSYTRCTCNPDPDSFIAKLIDWWIDQDELSVTYGLPIPERAGVIRWFVRDNEGALVWGSEDEYHSLGVLYGYENLTSFTFIPATTKDNPAMLKNDPGYTAKLRSLPPEQRYALEQGNWKIRPITDGFIKTSLINVEMIRPTRFAKLIRTWDFAATEGGGDWTVGMLLGVQGSNIWCLNIVRGQWDVGARNRRICDVAQADDREWGEVRQYGEKQVAAAGKDMAMLINSLLKQRTGREMIWMPTGGRDKMMRAETFAQTVSEGRFYCHESRETASFLRRLGAFPNKHIPDDEVDTASMGCVILRNVEIYGPSGWGKGRNKSLHVAKTRKIRTCYQIRPGQRLH